VDVDVDVERTQGETKENKRKQYEEEFGRRNRKASNSSPIFANTLRIDHCQQRKTRRLG
jgi:hypothetical protein